jgi:hypothetical protein
MLCLLLKALLVLHCKLALYYVQHASCMCCLHVLKAVGCARTRGLSGSGDIILL